MNKNKLLQDYQKLLSTFSFLKKFKGIRLKTVEDIKRIPLTHRLEIQDFGTGSCPEKPYIYYEATGGASGVNFFIGINRASHQGMVDRAGQALALMGDVRGKSCLNLLFSDLVEKGVLNNKGVLMSVGDVHSHKTMLLARDALRQLEIEYVFACPNLLASVLEPLGRNHRVRKCMVSGELLLPSLRDRFVTGTGIKLYNWYGSSGGFIAAQDDPKDPFMLVLDQGLHLEVMDDQGKTSLTGTGTLIYTDLYNYSTPLIRYALEDRVEMIQRGKCRYIKVLFRSGEHIKVDGELVYKGFIIERLTKVMKKKPFFVLVRKDHSYQDYIEIFIEEWTPAQQRVIVELFSDFMGLRPVLRAVASRRVDRFVYQLGHVYDCRRLQEKDMTMLAV